MPSDRFSGDTERCDRCEVEAETTTLYRDGCVWGQFCIECHDEIAEFAASKELVADGDQVEEGIGHVAPIAQGTAVKSDFDGLYVLTLTGQCSCGARDYGLAPDWKVPAENGGGYMTSNCPECLGTMEYSEQWERVDRFVSDYSDLKPRSLSPDTDRDGGESDAE